MEILYQKPGRIRNGCGNETSVAVEPKLSTILHKVFPFLPSNKRASVISIETGKQYLSDFGSFLPKNTGLQRNSPSTNGLTEQNQTANLNTHISKK